MSRAGNAQRKIERATRARRAAWAAGDALEAARRSEELDELYAELRLARARSQNGSPDSIVKKARVERELEKLMS